MVVHPRWCNINICACATLILYRSGLVLQDFHRRIFIFSVFPCDIYKVYISYDVGLSLKFRTVLCLLCVVFWLPGMGLLIPLLLIWMLLTFQSLPVTWCTASLTFNNCTLCPHRIYVFCIYLRTNSDLCHLQHKLIGFYNRDEKWLQRGTDWVFK